MKKIYTLIAATLLAATTINATVRTVSGNGLGGAQFTNITAAIAASSNNDTIYVSGSSTAYADFTVNKRLIIIAPGRNIGGATQNTQGVFVQNIYIDSTAINQSSTNVKLIGFGFGNIYISHGRNITIERCAGYQIQEQTNDCSGISIRGCNFDRFNNHYQATNNSIEISNSAYFYANVLTPNTIINHCIILGQSYSTSWTASGTIFTNNIFYNTNFSSGTNNGCVFTNNLTFGITIASFALPLPGSTGSNNQNQIDPLFVSTNIQTVSWYWDEIDNYNWRLQTTSPGHNAASDGADLGIYGGGLAMNQMGIIPAIPQVNEINIGNAAVPQNGTLNLNFKARKQN